MIKTKGVSFLKYNKFTFGEQVVSQFVVFEIKWLCSMIFFYFHKSKSSQDRFHTHAFNAISIKVFGEYDEHILDDEATGKYHTEKRVQVLKYFRKNHYHRIANSNGCLTIFFSGKWDKTWKEYIDGKVVDYTWGRQ